MQAAWVVLIKPKLLGAPRAQALIEAAKKRLHRNVLAIALANQSSASLGVFACGGNFEARNEY